VVRYRIAMKKIVDINYLQEPDLEDYLAMSKDNHVVFTDVLGIEIHKCNALENLSDKLIIVSQYPDQVFVLKKRRDIKRLTLAPSNLPHSLIDKTIDFGAFCTHTQSASKGDELLSKQVADKQCVASQYVKEQMKFHQLVVDGIRGISKSHNPSHIKALKNGNNLPPLFTKRATTDILCLARLLHEKDPDVQSVSKFRPYKDSYICRFAVCAYLLLLRWIKDGGIDQVSETRLFNDLMDVHYVAYATYFDGVLSRDKKLNEIHLGAMYYFSHFDNPNVASSPRNC